MLTKNSANRITRRRFLKHTANISLKSSAMMFLIEGCDKTSYTSHTPPNKNQANSAHGPVTIEWESEHDPIGAYSALVKAFNKINNHGIYVTLLDTSSDKQHDDLAKKLNARHGSPDVISMDIIWTDEFASKGWVIPLDDLWPTSQRQGYLPTPLDGAKYQGQLWAAPLRTDVGLLYYRNDLFSTPPTTWSELVTMVQHATGNNKPKYGYVWQGKQYEGVVCNFIELLSGYGGNILDPQNLKRVVVNSAEANQALAMMKSWIGTISPPDILLYDEDRSNAVWTSGDAMFMRNWPTSIALSNDANYPKVAQKFDVTSLPSATAGINTRSCLGGWNLGINAFSKKQDAAWEFIHWMLGEDAQKFLAIDASFTVTLESVYNDPYVLQQNPLYTKLPPIIKQAQLRPKSPHYPDITKPIQQAVYDALTGRSSIESSLADLQSNLQKLV